MTFTAKGIDHWQKLITSWFKWPRIPHSTESLYLKSICVAHTIVCSSGISERESSFDKWHSWISYFIKATPTDECHGYSWVLLLTYQTEHLVRAWTLSSEYRLPIYPSNKSQCESFVSTSCKKMVKVRLGKLYQTI